MKSGSSFAGQAILPIDFDVGFFQRFFQGTVFVTFQFDQGTKHILILVTVGVVGQHVLHIVVLLAFLSFQIVPRCIGFGFPSFFQCIDLSRCHLPCTQLLFVGGYLQRKVKGEKGKYRNPLVSPVSVPLFRGGGQHLLSTTTVKMPCLPPRKSIFPVQTFLSWQTTTCICDRSRPRPHLF